MIYYRPCYITCCYEFSQFYDVLAFIRNIHSEVRFIYTYNILNPEQKINKLFHKSVDKHSNKKHYVDYKR